MNSQKQVTITDLKGKFTKDFDTFGKMDPFLQFTVGKCFGKTEIASSAGKQPAWKNPVVLTYFDELQIVVRAYDDDVTQKQFIGSGKLDVKSLGFPGGLIDLKILTDKGQVVGTVTGRYTIKNLTQFPLLLLKNFRLELGTQQKTILKSKPFLQFSADENSDQTSSKDEIKGFSIAWNQNLRLRIKQSSKINISLIDKDNKEDYLFRHQCFAKQFRSQAGTKRFNVLNKKFQKFAVLQFDYETVNFVSKEESVKNVERQKKTQNQLTAILIQKIKAQLKIQGKDIYFKLIVGTNNYITEVFKKNQKQFTIQVKKTLYAENSQNKLVIVLFSKDLIGQSILGFGHITLQSLLNGEKKISLINQSKEDVGSVTLAPSFKTNPFKTFNLQNLSLNMYEDGDLIGQSEPFVVAKIGSCTGSTQIGESNRLTFKKGIQLKYFDEQFLQLQIWDEDATTNELLYSQKIKLSDLKANKGQQQLIFKVTNSEGKAEPKAKLIFKYQSKSNVVQVSRKTTEKKIEAENPKKEVINPHPVQQEKQKTKSVQVPQKVQPPNQVINQPPTTQQKPAKKEEVLPIQKPIKTQQSQPIQKPIKVQQSRLIQKPIKTSQVQPMQKPLKTQESQPIQKMIPTSIKIQPNQTQKARYSVHQKDQLKSSKRQEFNNRNQTFINNSSKQSVILPSIMRGSKIFGDKIYDKQSVATLQKSIVAYSMPKAMRFVNQPKYSGEPSYCMDSCFKPNPTKGAGFGFGAKKAFPDWMERNMKENPPPGAYIDDNGSFKSKGPSFGLSHKYYQKVIIPKEQKASGPIGHTVRKLSPIRAQKK